MAEEVMCKLFHLWSVQPFKTGRKKSFASEEMILIQSVWPESKSKELESGQETRYDS